MINIRKILKNVKNGVTLYSPLFGNVVYKGIYGEKINCEVTLKNGNKTHKHFDEFGRIDSDIFLGECLLFPSFENRDWEKFSPIPMHTTVICSKDGFNWIIRKYLKINNCYLDNPDIVEQYKYICEIDKFDFQNFYSIKNRTNSFVKI